MAASILRLGRLGSFKCLHLESWGVLRSRSAVLFCSKSGEPETPVKKTKASSKTDAPNERAALLAYKTTVAFPIRLSKHGCFSAQSVDEAESVVSSTATEKIIATASAACEPAVVEQEVAGPAAPAVSSKSGNTAADLSSSSSSSESESDSDSDTEDEKAHIKSKIITSQPVIKEPTVKEEAMKDTNEAQRESETAPASGVEAVQDSMAPTEADKDVQDMTYPEDAALETDDAPPAVHPAQGQSPEKDQTDTCIKTMDSVSAEADGKSGHEETPEQDPVAKVLGLGEAHAPAVETLMDSLVEAAPEPAEGVPEHVRTEAICEATTEVAAEVTSHAESAEELVDAAPVIPEAKHDSVDNVLDPGEGHAPAIETLMEDSPIEAAPEPAEGVPLPVGTETFCEVAAEVTSHAESAEELVDDAPVIPEAGGEDLQTEGPVDQSEETVVVTPPEPEEPFDNSAYKNYQHHSYNPYTFADMDVEMAKFRIAQPSSGRPSPRH